MSNTDYKKIFEQVTGLKPNKKIIKMLDDLTFSLKDKNHKDLDPYVVTQLNRIAEKVINNETSFFRDNEVFQVIKDKFLNDAIKIWSAGCSFGQEAYSLALLKYYFEQNKKFQIYATDISKKVLESAKEGTYQIHRTSEKKRILSFLPNLSSQLGKNVNNNLELKMPTLIKDKISFNQHNLLTPPHKIEFDLIMCRNVLIYMNEEARHKVFKNLSHAIKPMGWLVMGSADPKPPKPWKMFSVKNGIFWQYQKN